jgi:cell division initiation protein
MIDLTPLDVRKKKGDFRRGMRGYDIPEVDGFLEMVAERMEELVRENATLRERTSQLADALSDYRGREQAMNDALVSAQQLREEIRTQSQRDAELTLREARGEAERMLEEAKRAVEEEQNVLHHVRTQRNRFLRSYRAFLESQLAEIDSEEERRARAQAEGRDVEAVNADD